ncbi:MAG TPA: hypothetical protein VER04_22415, partial [Polyangiaceae bacterium]|nr:hypothetical protein [Polyangiaceae bacterium]
QPHTGANSIVHSSGIGWHVPDMSPAPHLAESAYEQNCFSAHLIAAMPPHILPAAAADAGVAGAGAEADGGGPELTTPVGVSTGRAPAVAVAVALVGLAFAGALADGVGCAEQATRAVNDRNVMHTRIRIGWPMPQL